METKVNGEKEQTEINDSISEKQTVLIAIDGSSLSEYAFDYYAANIYDETHNILLVNICNLPELVIGSRPILDRTSYDRQVEAEQNKVKVLQDFYGTKMAKFQMQGRMIAIFSSKPGESLCKVAEREKCMLVVVGTRGMGTAMILGSVSNYILHHAHCPVCVCCSA